MEKVVLRNIDNEEIFNQIVDKRCENILIHNFNPHERIEWWTTTIKIDESVNLVDVNVRSMSFDLQTNISNLEKILKLNNSFLSIYQFNCPIPNTLMIDALPENGKDAILKQNGLEHIIFIELEDTIVASYSSDFINSIRENSNLASRIII